MIYRIKDWEKLYENNRTKDLKNMQWLPIPNRHDGDGYTTLIDRPNGCALFGAWIAVLQVASRCEPRGTLVRDCGTNPAGPCGNPAGRCGEGRTLLRGGAEGHNSTSLSRMTRIPEKIIKEMLAVCVDECKWLEIIEDTTIPQEGAGKPQEGAGHRLRMEWNGMEWKGIEREGKASPGRFAPPTLPQVQLQCAKIGLAEAEAERFFNHYTANGWKVGRNPMKNWIAALSMWKSRSYDAGRPAMAPTPGTLSGIDKSILSREFDDVVAKMRTIKMSYEAHQTWADDDKSKWQVLIARKKEISGLLGIKT